MLELELDYLRKIRVWFKRNDDLVLQEINVSKERFPSTGATRKVHSTVIVELFVPRGGRNVYGLLGADYFYSALDNIEISVSGGNIIRPKLFNNSLAGKMGLAKICLPDEIRVSVFEEVRSISEDAELDVGGKLDFRYGAYSDVSSNEWIFRKLTRLVVKLLNVPEKELSAGLLGGLING